MIGVIEPERQPQQRGDRPQRDVTLLPGQFDANDLLAFPFAATDDAEIRNAAGVGTGLGAGQREAGHFKPLGETRQVVIFLRIGAVVQQQLRRPQRIGHHHRYRSGAAARGDFHHHFRMRQRREALAAECLRNNHAEKAVILDELPGARRQIMQLVGDLPVVEHRAEFFDRAVDESLFFRGQGRLRISQQLAPVGIAAEEFAIPPHGTGVERLLLGLRHLRQNTAKQRQQRCAQHGAAQHRRQRKREHDDEAEAECRVPHRRHIEDRQEQPQPETGDAGPQPGTCTYIGQRARHREQRKHPPKHHVRLPRDVPLR